MVTEYLTADAYPDLGLKTGKWDSINYKKLKNIFTYETQQLNGIGKIMNMTMKEYLKSVQTPRSFLNTASHSNTRACMCACKENGL